jgi:hypothetical protein
VLAAPLAVVATNPAVQDRTRAWQGAWVVRDADYPGSVEAWNVHGDTIERYDPVAHRSARQHLAFESPCRLVRTQVIGSGGAVVSRNTFAFAPDGLHVAPAQTAGGVRQGDLLTACIGDRVYTFDTRSQDCQEWNKTMSGSPLPAEECATQATPPSFVLRRFLGGGDVELTIAGDALLSVGLLGHVSERAASFDAAMRRAEALSSAH